MKPKLVSNKVMYQLMKYNHMKVNKTNYFRKMINFVYQYIAVIIIIAFIVCILYYRYITKKENLVVADINEEDIKEILEDVKIKPTRKKITETMNERPLNLQKMNLKSLNNKNYYGKEIPHFKDEMSSTYYMIN